MNELTWRYVLVPIGSMLVGALVAIFAEPCRQWLFGPNVKIGYLNDNEHVVPIPARAIQTMLERSYRAGEVYVRVRVVNRGRAMAREARAYVERIEKERDGHFIPTGFADPVQIPWSTRPKSDWYGTWDLPTDMPVFSDVFTTKEGSTEWHPPFQVTSNWLRDIYSTPGTYRIHIVVAGNGFKPDRLVLELNWKGDWKGFTVGEAQVYF